MKLKLLGNFGQRDSRYGDIILGYNSPTSTDSVGHKFNIWWYGCLITSLGNYIGKTPQEVNQLLKDNGGFTKDSGNFIWSKSSVLGLTPVYSSPVYNSAVTPQGIAKMKALLDEGRPLLTHIDFNPATTADDQHWVLVTGYEGDTFYIFDPWSGTDTSLDVYGGVARAVIEFKAYDKILNKEEDDPLVVCLAQHSILVDKCNQKDKNITDLQNQIREKDIKILNFEKDLSEWNNVKKAFGIQNLVELDAKILATQTGNLDNYVLKTKYDEDIKSVKEDTTKTETVKCDLKMNKTKKDLLAKIPYLIKLIYKLDEPKK